MTDRDNTTVEPFITIKQAAEKLGRPYWQIQRFVKSGAIPVYRIGNKRKLIRLLELIRAIEASNAMGGAQ